MTRAQVIQLLDEFFGTKYQPGEDVGIFLCRVKTAASRLQEAGHKVNDLYLGFQMIRYLPQEFQSTVQQIYRRKDGEFTTGKIKAELILEANRLQLMKQDLEKTETVFLSSASTSRKSSAVPGGADTVPGDARGNKWYQKEDGKVFVKQNKTTKRYVKKIGPCILCKKYGYLKVNCKDKNTRHKSLNENFNTEFRIKLKFSEAECSLIELNAQSETSCNLSEEISAKGVWVIDTAATTHFCNDKSLFLDIRQVTNMQMLLAIGNKDCPVEGIGTIRFLVKNKDSFNEITLSDVLYNPKLRRNLLSVSRLEKKGAHFVGSKEQQGINHEKTNSYTPEQNGVAERYNLTALDGVKTLLKSSGVAQKFWDEALLCFTYTWNRVCHKDGNKTPFEKYSGKKPSVLHLKPFGCLAYVGVPKQIRKKLDMRAKLGIMMGYALHTKGYRIWLRDEKLIETINVRFDENTKGVYASQNFNQYTKFNFTISNYSDDEGDFDTVMDSLSGHLIPETSSESPSTSREEPSASTDSSLIPCSEIKRIQKIGREVTGAGIYYGIKGKATRLTK
ncbi:Retrovirus-related Pol polyprotein from transposon TNT 1-94 [Araneus ventricosus]|uniref:Retrovirus-related Pol polyprotein from transposon TNT 1-94 n=1 Tax=Araneus ventricosus TaxID=182803 RepID=A0A4Y2A508_ARAVE|nr:Retrovirus-related Pol polyprotein from transposon TNT 1-94 [Araneus ventricosus]